LQINSLDAEYRIKRSSEVVVAAIVDAACPRKPPPAAS